MQQVRKSLLGQIQTLRTERKPPKKMIPSRSDFRRHSKSSSSKRSEAKTNGTWNTTRESSARSRRRWKASSVTHRKRTAEKLRRMSDSRGSGVSRGEFGRSRNLTCFRKLMNTRKLRRSEIN